MTWPGRARAAFVFVVGALFVTAQIQIWGAATHGVPGGRIAESALATAFTLPLLGARRFPLPVLLVLVAAAGLHQALGGELGQPWFAILLALFALGDRGTARASTVGLFVVATAILSVDLPRLQEGAALEDVLPAWFILGGAWSFGRWVRSRRRAHDELTARTEAAERDREAATRAAVAHERALIARELHDMVAHSLAVIVLQAQAADRVLPTDVAAAKKALGSIESVGREGLVELRRMLELLLVSADDRELDPRPSLRHLDLLVDRVREAGLPVDLDLAGEPRTLPPGLDLSAYRIVQESLTNVLKHAGGASAKVEVSYLPDRLEITVSDDGSGDPGGRSASVGRGLIGMRERVALYGGTFAARPGATGGFTVSASLPLGASTP